MNRSVIILAGFGCFLFSGGTLIAQEQITPLAGNPSAEAYHDTHRIFKKSSTVDTLELPFFDDFSSSQVEPDPSIWSDADAFVNNNYCINPVTNGVVTLDAIDYQGSIYPGATIDPKSFVADHLTSHPIRLALTPGDSIYLSFLYQPGGLGDRPEEQDSLLLDFFDPADTAWVNVWSTPGTDLHPFKTVMIPITGNRFLVNGFMFRFRNLASLPRNTDYPDKKANVDHWNVDYIRIDRNRFAADTILRDVAFSTPINSVLEDLTSLPWSHFEDARNTIFDQTVMVRYRNNDTISRNITRSLLIEEPMYNESYSPGPPTAQDIPALEDTVVNFDYFYAIDSKRGTSAIVRLKSSLRTDEFDPKVNDTVIYDQIFDDYYSYDDGTAEAGYGLRGQGTRNGNVAMKYFAYTADDIGGVDISFNHLYDSVNANYYFKLIVWADNDGIPGRVLYEDEKDLTPDFPNQFPGFVRYYFDKPVHVDGAFFVGWRQYNEYMLNVGLDLNNKPSPHVMYYNYQGIWQESNAPGVMLFRPFLYNESTEVKEHQLEIETAFIYPNPATDQLNIQIPGEEGKSKVLVDLFDSSGRLAHQQVISDGQMNISHLSRGIYFLNLHTKTRTYKAKLLIN